MNIELTSTVSADDLIDMIVDSICTRCMERMSSGMSEEALHFISELEKRFQDGELTVKLAEHFIVESIKCGIITDKDELYALVEEHEDKLND